jgi:hypothetical protein
MKAGKRKPDKDMFDLDFDEAMARLMLTVPEEVEDMVEAIKKEDEGVKAYVEERQDSIRRGARRTKHRFGV